MTLPERLPIVVIACQVFTNLIERHMPAGMADEINFFDYGLHRVPTKLNWTVQQAVDEIKEPSLIVLGYGLCGNGLKDIKAGVHTLLIPRADDCIAILLGSYQDYIHEFESSPGTYYLTKGWLESGSNPLKEYLEYREKYGEESAMWIMDQQYQHYKRLVFVAHSEADLEEYRAEALEVAEFCKRWDMVYEERLGSEGYVKRLVEVAKVLDKAGDDFIVIPPGGELRQSQFIR